jgi:hypothetical protein
MRNAYKHVAHMSMENVGSQFLSLRQLRRREPSLAQRGAVKIATFSGRFAANLSTAAPARNPVAAFSLPLFSRPLDYDDPVRILYVLENINVSLVGLSVRFESSLGFRRCSVRQLADFEAEPAP